MTDLKKRMRDNMLIFGKVCIPQMFTVKSPDFHFEIARYLHDTNEKRLNIIAPRGHGKSSILGAVFPLHHLMFDEGRKFIVLVSKTEGHAIRLLDTIKDILNYSQPFREQFGYHGMFVAQQWKSTEVVLDTGDMIMTRGTGQQVVGLKHLNQRPTLVILDDPEDMSNTKTEESMEFNLRWMLQSLYPSLDPKRGRIIVIGTPQHQRCIVETLKGAKGWTTLRYKALGDDGAALWPEWWSKEKLEEERRNAESIGRISMFYREFQCEVVGDEGQLFKESYIRYYDGTVSHSPAGDEAFLHIQSFGESTFEKPRVIPVNIFMGVDPASSVREGADYSTIVPVAIDAEYNRYILPYFRARVTPLTLADKIISWYEQYKPRLSRVESVGYQEMLREYLRQKRYIPGLEIKESPRNSKSMRLESMQPYFASGKVYMQRNMRELIDELLLYPKGKHDDLLDGMFYAFKGNFTPHHRIETVSTMSDHMKYYIGLADEDDIEWERKQRPGPYEGKIAVMSDFT